MLIGIMGTVVTIAAAGFVGYIEKQTPVVTQELFHPVQHRQGIGRMFKNVMAEDGVKTAQISTVQIGQEVDAELLAIAAPGFVEVVAPFFAAGEQPQVIAAPHTEFQDAVRRANIRLDFAAALAGDHLLGKFIGGYQGVINLTALAAIMLFYIGQMFRHIGTTITRYLLILPYHITQIVFFTSTIIKYRWENSKTNAKSGSG
ncbi:MAG: hypothetical protein BWY71_00275 [Planctomycetes bacterium ADurb.Bin412]|nr:MAG: hypothetical protein BWY71_00275 [Planctomycetes bacterium ADurb.Bin412]